MDSSRWSLKGRTSEVTLGRAAHCVLRGESDLNDQIPVSNHVEIIGDSMSRERELEVGENDKKPLTVKLLNLLRNLVEVGLLAFVRELTTMASSNLIPDLVEIASTLLVPALRGTCCF
jgi:hypothetical protein